MARPPQQHKKTARNSGPETETYYVLDDKAKEIAGKKLVDVNGKPVNQINLTPAEAAFHIANGSISTRDPKENDAAAKAMHAAEKKHPDAVAKKS